MKSWVLFLGVFAISLILSQNAQASPTAQIIMEKTTFSYGERLVYTIEVSEVTGDFAIIHIRDDSGKGSSAIPISITNLKTEIPSPYPFEKEIFAEGKYFIDLNYSGASYTAEFFLVDSGNIVIPFQTKQIAYSWINNQVSGGIFVDFIQKTVDEEIINIPYEIDRDKIGEVLIPNWARLVTIWWLDEKISDETFANCFQYLIDEKIIKV